MTLPSRHRNSNPGGLRPWTLSPRHGGSHVTRYDLMVYKFECGSGAEPLAFGVIEDNDNYHTRALILVQVTIYRRLLIGRDGHLDQSEAYDIS